MGLDGVGERSYSQHRRRRVILVNILGPWRCLNGGVGRRLRWEGRLMCPDWLALIDVLQRNWREHVHNRLEASEPDWNCVGYLR